MTKCWRWAIVILFTGGGVLHHSSASKERLGKEPALGPAGLRPPCAPQETAAAEYTASGHSTAGRDCAV